MKKKPGPAWLKDFPDVDSAGYPCKITYPTSEQMDSISHYCDGPPMTIEEVGAAFDKIMREVLTNGKGKQRQEKSKGVLRASRRR